jgi:hypothetical protein
MNLTQRYVTPRDSSEDNQDGRRKREVHCIWLEDQGWTTLRHHQVQEVHQEIQRGQSPGMDRDAQRLGGDLDPELHGGWHWLGGSAVAFETALQDAKTAEEGHISPISVEHINQALNAVTETVFSHRALETQRLWMNGKMLKLVELTTRLMAASISRLNSAMPFFPTATASFQKLSLLGFWIGLFRLYGGPSLTWTATSPHFTQGTSWLKPVKQLNKAKSASVIKREQAKLDGNKKPEKCRKIVAT